MRDLIGSNVLHYRILDLLGEGGMGAVYRALDTRLEREVALKILPEQVTSDPERVRRFAAEARAASALNHPHVMAIYDIGEAGGIRYIAMELIDGQTLREFADSGRVEIRKAVKLVMQIAEALTAAHAVGIIHRDLKPENVMVTSAGHAKVLDFGLAKLRVREERGEGTTTTARTLQRETLSGVVMGTAGYMSPEQAQGKSVDQRSDIFSLGCILYELTTGQRAFQGESSVDTLHKIIYDDPAPLYAMRADAPPELVRIVRKSLAKDPDERYQTAKDLAIDLHGLLRDLESSPSSAPTAVPMAAPRWQWLWLAAAVLAIIVAGALALRRWQVETPPAAAELQIRRLTSLGSVIEAAISPDGQYLAYVSSQQGKQSLWLQQIATSQTIQLRPEETVEYWGLAFSPDGASIYYGVKTDTDQLGRLFRIATLGGSPVEILRGIDSQVTFSPDGKQIAYVRQKHPARDKSALMVANSDGTGQRIIATRTYPELFAPIFFTAPAWSPDGTRIAAAVRRVIGDPPAGIVVMRSDGSDQKGLSNKWWGNVAQVEWLPDGKGLLAIAYDQPASTGFSGQIYLLPYPEGEPRRITRDLTEYRIISLTRDRRSLVTIPYDFEAAIWRVPLGEGKPARLTHAKYDGFLGVAVASDGRIIFTSGEVLGDPNLWIANPDGSDRKPILSPGGRNRYPAVSSRGDVAFSTLKDKAPWLAIARLDGSGTRVLTPALDWPAFSPDARTIFFTTAYRGIATLHRISADGGSPIRLTDYGVVRPTVSPDGRQIACLCQTTPDVPLELCVIPAEGGPPSKRYPLNAYIQSKAAWTRDGKGILFTGTRGDRANVHLQPLDGSPRRQVTHFDDLIVFGFSPAPDGKSLLVVRGKQSRDAVLMTGFGP